MVIDGTPGYIMVQSTSGTSEYQFYSKAHYRVENSELESSDAGITHSSESDRL